MTSAIVHDFQPADLELRGQMSLGARHGFAAADLRGGFRLWRLALTLGWLDIRLRYRGSMLGPFWLTISTAVMVGALGVLYSQLFKIDVTTYLPFLALSQVLWGFLGSIVSESCTAFTDVEGVIRSVRMPFFVFCIRTLIRNAIALAHNIVVIVAVFAIYPITPSWEVLQAIPGVAIWGIDALALALLLGGFCARFRDIQPIVNSVMQIAFFLTPVIWKPDQLSQNKQDLLPFNPFFDLLEIVRGPILATPVSDATWIGALGYSAFLCALAWAFFIHARGRLTFWV